MSMTFTVKQTMKIVQAFNNLETSQVEETLTSSMNVVRVFHKLKLAFDDYLAGCKPLSEVRFLHRQVISLLDKIGE